MTMLNRTNIDFSRHEVEIIKCENALIHKFKRPDSISCSITFINSCGIMAVTGDFGNWIFCREFHPAPDADKISDGYWDEKLQINSVQKPYIFDTDTTLKLIEEFENKFEDRFDFEIPEDVIDWVRNLKNAAYDETEYTYTAYRETPFIIEYDYIPYGTIRHYSLNAIYDGFEALCEKLKNNKY